MKEDLHIAGKELPKNKDLPKDQYHDLILRELDCAVIEYLHQKIDEQIKLDILEKGFSNYKHFDTVRGIFTEGGPAFEGAGIQKNKPYSNLYPEFKLYKRLLYSTKRS